MITQLSLYWCIKSLCGCMRLFLKGIFDWGGRTKRMILMWMAKPLEEGGGGLASRCAPVMIHFNPDDIYYYIHFEKFELLPWTSEGIVLYGNATIGSSVASYAINVIDTCYSCTHYYGLHLFDIRSSSTAELVRFKYLIANPENVRPLKKKYKKMMDYHGCWLAWIPSLIV